jgi:transcription elongation GreA/GreB family factor
MNKARLITALDVPSDEIGIGSVVELKDNKGQHIKYTLLGPWDADPDAGILSYQSKLAAEMIGHKVGDVFGFREDEYKVISVKSYLEP